MPQRSKLAAKSDTSQSEALWHNRRTKRLRIDSDEEEEEDYEPREEQSTSYNESYTRGGGRSSSPIEPVSAATKRQKFTIPSPEEREGSDYEDRVGDYDDRQDDGDDESFSGRDNSVNYQEDEDGYDEYGSRLTGKKRRGEVASPLRRHSSPAAASTSTPLLSQTTSGGRTRRSSIKSKHATSSYTARTTTPTPNTKKLTGRGKSKASTSSKRKRKDGESEEGEDYHDYEDEEDVEDEDEDDEAKFSEENDDYEEPTRGKKRRGSTAGRGKVREREKEKDIVKKTKFEGNPTTTSPAPSTKRPRVKRPTGDDAMVDIMDDSGSPEPSNLASPTTTTGADGPKADTPTTNPAPLAKKRKLPTIKKLKSIASSSGATGAVLGSTGTGPSTPSSTVAPGAKSAALPPPASSSTTVGSTANKLGILPAAGSTRPKTNATSDLDLSNPSLYAELFKNPGGSASRTGLNRRAKEEERKKELDKMRDEYKANLVETKAAFDLQGQAEKMARFEEALRQRRSSALYPNFLAAKWREESEREKRRLQRSQSQYQQQAQVNGHADNGKEEGEM